MPESVLTNAGGPNAQDRDGIVEAVRTLRVARRSAIKARSAAPYQMTSLLVSAPDPLKAELAGLTDRQLVGRTAALRPRQLTTPHRSDQLALQLKRPREKSNGTD